MYHFVKYRRAYVIEGICIVVNVDDAPGSETTYAYIYHRAKSRLRKRLFVGDDSVRDFR